MQGNVPIIQLQQTDGHWNDATDISDHYVNSTGMYGIRTS